MTAGNWALSKFTDAPRVRVVDTPSLLDDFSGLKKQSDMNHIKFNKRENNVLYLRRINPMHQLMQRDDFAKCI